MSSAEHFRAPDPGQIDAGYERIVTTAPPCVSKVQLRTTADLVSAVAECVWDRASETPWLQDVD
ncbi:MAG: hypothetical protein GY939_19290 [Actinomycetia bacterium]|nr:hypothetical protein [Actinomycetes bacterium]